MFQGSGGSKSRLAKAAGAEPFGRMRDQKLHAAVARGTLPSQKGKSTSGLVITTIHLSLLGFLSLNLPPRPCAVLYTAFAGLFFHQPSWA